MLDDRRNRMLLDFIRPLDIQQINSGRVFTVQSLAQYIALSHLSVRSSATYNIFKKTLNLTFWTIILIVTFVYFDYVQRSCSLVVYTTYRAL